MKKMLVALLMCCLFVAGAAAETTEVILTCTGDFMPGSNDRIKNEKNPETHSRLCNGDSHIIRNIMRIPQHPF